MTKRAPNVVVAALIVVSVIWPRAGRAELSPTERSINGTADTLTGGRFEVGIASLSVGVTDSLMLTIPTLPLAFGLVSAAIRYRFVLTERLSLSPEVGAGFHVGSTSAGWTAGARLGAALGDRQQHGITLGGGVARTVGPPMLYGNRAPATLTTNATWLLEYDYYTNGGNLFYVGVASIVPYFGYTWAWKNLHLGAISSLASLFIPLPYLYFRF